MSNPESTISPAERTLLILTNTFSVREVFTLLSLTINELLLAILMALLSEEMMLLLLLSTVTFSSWFSQACSETVAEVKEQVKIINMQYILYLNT